MSYIFHYLPTLFQDFHPRFSHIFPIFRTKLHQDLPDFSGAKLHAYNSGQVVIHAVGPKLRDLLKGVQGLSRAYLNVLSEYCQADGGTLVVMEMGKLMKIMDWLVVTGTRMDYDFPFHIWNVIIPSDFHSIIFQRGWGKPPSVVDFKGSFQMESVWKWGCRGAIVVQWRHFMGMINHGISIGGIFRPIHQLLSYFSKVERENSSWRLENLETWRLECDYGAVLKVTVLLVLPSLYNG